jgi:hypothetical protein
MYLRETSESARRDREEFAMDLVLDPRDDLIVETQEIEFRTVAEALEACKLLNERHDLGFGQ